MVLFKKIFAKIGIKMMIEAWRIWKKLKGKYLRQTSWMMQLTTPSRDRWISLNHFMLWIWGLLARLGDFSPAQGLVAIFGKVVNRLSGNPPEPHRKDEEVEELARAQEAGLKQGVAHVVPASQTLSGANVRLSAYGSKHTFPGPTGA